jgi:putrescine transport system permease protein
MIRAWLIAGLAFLYLPLVVLVGTSVNAERLAGAWGGFSGRWYRMVLADDRMMQAAWLSLEVAVLSATLATILGGLAGHALARGRMRWRDGFAGLLLAPLVLPDLLIGFAFLLLFVVLGAPRGAGTIVLAHATIGMAYVAVVVEARLASAGVALEDAARDLGATRLGALWRITIPLASPALAAGWLLAFTLSMDDLVVASFVSGPGATTLPMVVFSALRLGASPALAAVATLVLGVLSLTLLAGLLLRRNGAGSAGAGVASRSGH